MKFFKKTYKEEQEQYFEYVWIFAIVFVLVLFLSQALLVSIVGQIKSGFLWLLLITWSILAAYYLLFGNGHFLYERVKQRISLLVRKEIDEKQIDKSITQKPKKFIYRTHDVNESDIYLDVFGKKLEQEAHDRGALISGEGIKHIMNFGDGAGEVLKDVIERGCNTYPRFDGWIILNKSQVVSLLSHSLEPRVPFSVVIEETDKEDEGSMYEEAINAEFKIPPVSAEHTTEIVDEEFVFETKNNKAPTNLPTGTSQLNNPVAVATFIGHLCKGDEGTLFVFIQDIKQGSHNGISMFVKEAILMLDRVHEHRVGGVGYVDERALENTSSLSNKELEELISILVGSIDFRYRLPETGVKLSLVRALEYVKERRKYKVL